jgi:hypothetical protein
VNLSIRLTCKSKFLEKLTDNRYSLGGTDEDWSDALASRKKQPKEGMVVSVKSGKEKKRKGESLQEVLDAYDKLNEKRKKKHRH